MIEIKLSKRNIEKRMLKKITPFIAGKIRSVCDEQKVSLYEIAATIGISSSRLSELINYENYTYGGVTAKNLSLIIQGGIVTINELQTNVVLTEAEKDVLEENYSLYEDKEVRTLLIECKKKGLDYKKVLRDLLKKTH